jgi:hypothetical protein
MLYQWDPNAFFAASFHSVWNFIRAIRVIRGLPSLQRFNSEHVREQAI